MRISTPVLWNPTHELDAYNYQIMAQNLRTAYDIAPDHHWQRLLPSLAAKYIGQLLKLTPIDGAFGHNSLQWSFYFLASLGVLILMFQLGLFLNLFFANKMWGNYFSFLILFQFWPYFFNLFNIYQLCDLYSYVISLLFFNFFINEKWKQYFIGAIFSIFVRQNLWILIFFIDIYLWKKKLVSLKILTINFLLQSALIFSLMLVSKGKGGTTVNVLFLLPTLNDLTPLRSIYHSMGIFFWPSLVFIKNFSKILRLYWPFFFYALIVIYQPMAFWQWTGPINTERILNQGVFVLNVLAVINLAQLNFEFEKDKVTKIIFFSIPFFWGTYPLRGVTTALIYPFIKAPGHFADYSILLVAFWALFRLYRSVKGRARMIT